MLASVSSSVTSQVASHGAYAVFGLMAIDAVFPAGSELVMLYAGALAAGVFTSAGGVSIFGGHVGFGIGAYVALALAGTLGYLGGALVGWAVGLWGGRPLLERHGRWLHLGPERLDRAETWFARWGNLGVLLGRITPVVRSFVSIPAGVFETPVPRYTLLTAVGSAIWCFAWAGAGWGLGASWEGVHKGFAYVDYGVVAGIAAGAAYLFLRRRRSITMARRASDSSR